MGTSVSQPSPTASSEGGNEWNDVKDSIRNFTNIENITSKLVVAYESQYDASASEVIVDRGVESVITSLERQISANTSSEEKVLNMMLASRKELAINNCNSFFAEIALSAASTALMSNNADVMKKFASNYAKRIIDYIASRDLPMNIGTKGLTNLGSLDRVLSSSEQYFESKLNQSQTGTITEKLKSIFTQSGEVTDE
ncbi:MULTISPECIES: hypothetical protein [Pseudomonadati]|uniref:hypothetical protein n=1 Tax=Bacteriovoracales TaxID=2024979 RepID=UPI000386D20E|nr:hypothetical protein [Bacteriovorax sp. BAL6_X]EPZ51832.1 hypothetical protein M902_2349 [Bacteriovorax sp. BAL6_X]